MRMNHSGNEKTDFILEWVMLTAVLKNSRILAAQHTNWEAKNKIISDGHSRGQPPGVKRV